MKQSGSFEVPQSATQIPEVDGGIWPFVAVGAGAAGMLAGIFAARGGVRTLLLETRREPGAKIRVSGGARCNVLPSESSIDDFHTQDSLNSVRNVLQSWPLDGVRAFFEDELGIPLKVEPTGKVFPRSDDPREVVVGLLAALQAAGATLIGSARVTSISRVDRGAARFELELDDGRRVLATRLCLACGGLSLPKTGSDGRGFEMARELGHTLAPLYPALVPLLAADPTWGELAGLSLPVRLSVWRAGKRVGQRSGDFLFTHRGFSGPVALDVSWHFAGPDGVEARLEAAWLADGAPDWEAALRERGSKSVAAVLHGPLPRRLAARLLDRARLDPATKLAGLSREARASLRRELEACELTISGNEGYRTAEVTDGGVTLSELRTKSLESRLVPGLHFAGEIVDVSGRIGGYNFLWAWVSGRKVGDAVAAAIRS